MESFIHPTAFGELVRTERKRLKLSQVDFYLFLFPDTNKAEETIKKKMNSIENGKQKSIDFDFLLAVCQKCDVSADYILGMNISVITQGLTKMQLVFSTDGVLIRITKQIFH